MKKLIAALMLGIAAFSVNAECDHLYPYQKRIYIPNTIELCNSWYVTVYDEKNRRVLFVSQLLEKKDVDIPRKSFKSDPRVKNPVRNSEYAGSDWDKGHLVPAEDSTTEREMAETFFLTNAVPQAPKLNRGKWKSLESKVRNKTNTSIYVITGAIYEGKQPANMTVPVPSALYKIPFYPTGTEIWYADNADTATVIRVTKTDIEKRIGFKIPTN